VLARFADCDLPPLWKPRANQFFLIDAIPYLGTGKLDLRRLREMAIALSASARSASAE
jgi:acyl-[acyl-carrier-protein]-phospholipid O-acyltransferase/long-chain-fatty-acid--[acyl-carrier-protein] ligase